MGLFDELAAAEPAAPTSQGPLRANTWYGTLTRNEASVPPRRRRENGRTATNRITTMPNELCPRTIGTTPIVRTTRPLRATLLLATLLCAALLAPMSARAQSRVGSDSSTRLQRYVRDLGYGTSLGFVYAGVDQWRNDPVEWGDGTRGYERRLASDVGEFVVQESVTDMLAAAMNRPLDYQRCHCHGFGSRVGWALQGALTDPMPDGHRAFALPRVVGAYAGSAAQAAWRPATTSGRARTAVINGSMSLLIGAGINLFYELRR